jgi:DivIVA domain-containing protein
VTLDKKSIQRTDFSMARRGYDPAEVDAHLSVVADEVTALQAASHGGGSLASSASDHVRTIIEAAESSAAQIRREAQEDASQTRRQAEEDARDVSASRAGALDRLEATRRELDSVIESLRAGAGGSDAQRAPEPAPEVEAEAAHVSATAGEDGVTAGENGVGAGESGVTAAGSGVAGGSGQAADDAAGTDVTPTDDATPVTSPVPATDPIPATGPTQDAEDEPAAPAPQARGPANADAEGARLIALHMALNGTSRDETAKYLSENYQLADRDRLLDEVYSSVEG